MTTNSLLASIATQKAALDQLRPLRQGALDALQKHYDVDLTYTSNAIEGNTLSLRETAEVIEHGITVGGKSLREHLEAVDHYDTLQWVRQFAAGREAVSDESVRELHRRVVARSQPEIAGIYSRYPRRIAGSTVTFPNPLKIPDLMSDFGQWLRAAPLTPEAVFEGHFRLTAIHPFSDGNGRNARLLMNLLLIRGGCPPIAVRPVDRMTYLNGLERASLAGELLPFQTLMHERLDATLGEYLSALHEAPPSRQG